MLNFIPTSTELSRLSLPVIVCGELTSEQQPASLHCAVMRSNMLSESVCADAPAMLWAAGGVSSCWSASLCCWSVRLPCGIQRSHDTCRTRGPRGANIG